MARQCSVHIKCINLFNFPTTLWGQHYTLHPCCTDGKSEVQRNEVLRSGETGIWIHEVWLRTQAFNGYAVLSHPSHWLIYSGFRLENTTYRRGQGNKFLSRCPSTRTATRHASLWAPAPQLQPVTCSSSPQSHQKPALYIFKHWRAGWKNYKQHRGEANRSQKAIFLSSANGAERLSWRAFDEPCTTGELFQAAGCHSEGTCLILWTSGEIVSI